MCEHKFLKEQSCDQSSFNLYLVFGKLTKNRHNNEVKIVQNCNSFFPCGTWKSNIWWNSLVLYVTQAWCNKVRRKNSWTFLKMSPLFSIIHTSKSSLQIQICYESRDLCIHHFTPEQLYRRVSPPPCNNYLISEFWDLNFTICSLTKWVRRLQKRNFGSWILDFVVLVNSLGFK